MKIGIMGIFADPTEGYSLVHVAETQGRYLQHHGYEVDMLVLDIFKDPHKAWSNLSVKPVIPTRHFDRDNFEADQNEIMLGMVKFVNDYDVILTHDVIFQTHYLKYNLALREVAKRFPKLLWLHWVHSMPSTMDKTDDILRIAYCEPPGYLIAINRTKRQGIAKMYGVPLSRVKVCQNALHPLDAVGGCDLAYRLYYGAGFDKADVTCLYPIRMDRGKQLHKVVKILGSMRAYDIDPALLVCDWQSDGDNKREHREECRKLAADMGLNLTYASELQPEYCLKGTPRSVVLQLLRVTDVMIQASAAEMNSLVCQEAILNGCLLLTNSLPQQGELFGGLAMMCPLGSAGQPAPDTADHYSRIAAELLTELRNDRTSYAKAVWRTEKSPDALWPKELEPLLRLTPPRLSKGKKCCGRKK